jgi:hypothetical protein
LVPCLQHYCWSKNFVRKFRNTTMSPITSMYVNSYTYVHTYVYVGICIEYRSKCNYVDFFPRHGWRTYVHVCKHTCMYVCMCTYMYVVCCLLCCMKRMYRKKMKPRCENANHRIVKEIRKSVCQKSIRKLDPDLIYLFR